MRVGPVPGARHLQQAAAPVTSPPLELPDQAPREAATAVGGRDRDGGQPQPAGAVVEERDDGGAREPADGAVGFGDDHTLVRAERGERLCEAGLVRRVAQVGNERRERGTVAGPGVADGGWRRYPGRTARRPARSAAPASSTTRTMPTTYSSGPTPSCVTSARASENATATRRPAQMSWRSFMRAILLLAQERRDLERI